MDNCNDIRVIRARLRIEENIIDEGFGVLLEEWDMLYRKAKNIDKNINRLGTLPVGANQSYAVKKGYESVLNIQIKISECLESILSYTSS
jgi:hypothetical protein